jgi:hypothetical protein
VKPDGGSPKDDVIKFVPPEPIHTLKLGIFVTPYPVAPLPLVKKTMH